MGDSLKRVILIMILTLVTPVLWANTALVGWTVTYPSVEGNTKKSQLKNVLLEGLLTEFFNQGWIAFDSPREGDLTADTLLVAYGAEARKNGATLGLYFNVKWKDSEGNWVLDKISYVAVSFTGNKILVSGELKIPAYILPSPEEKALNSQLSDQLIKVFGQYF